MGPRRALAALGALALGGCPVGEDYPRRAIDTPPFATRTTVEPGPPGAADAGVGDAAARPDAAPGAPPARDLGPPRDLFGAPRDLFGAPRDLFPSARDLFGPPRDLFPARDGGP